jgi:hypothetical protein
MGRQRGPAAPAAVVADAADAVVIEMDGLGQDGRAQGSQGGAPAHRAAARRDGPVERLVRAVVIVVAAPGVEAGLGGFEAQKAAALQALGLAHGLGVAPRSAGRRLHKGSMPRRVSQTESLVEPFCRPPSFRSRGIAVVGDHRAGQAVPLEHPRQPLADRGVALVPASLRPEPITRMIVQHGQGKAALALAVGSAIQRAMALEIHLPQAVGRQGFEPPERLGRRGPALEQPAAPQNPGDRARRRHGRAGLASALQHPPDLPPSPGCPASVTRSNRSDTASLTRHGIDILPTATGRECHPSLRTGVVYVCGRYRGAAAPSLSLPSPTPPLPWPTS